MKKGRYVDIAVLLIIGLFLTALLLAYPMRSRRSYIPPYVGRAYAAETVLETAVLVYKMDHGTLPFTGSHDSPEQDVDYLTEFLKGPSGSGLGVYTYIHPGDSLPLDPWGRPYHVFFDTDDDGRTEIKPMTFVPEPVAIWSDGFNKLNEFGEGDDVCSWKERGEYTR